MTAIAPATELPVTPQAEVETAEDGRHRLRTLTVAYLGLPSMIFALGWTRLPVALLATLGLIGLLGLSIREARNADECVVAIPNRTLRWAVATCVGIMTGAAALVPQTWDWLKHNAMLRDLVGMDWPIMYDIDENRVGLVYYIGYYLPAASVGKVFGWQAAQFALLLWTILGIGLALAWFAALVNTSARWVIAVFVTFSGLDVIGNLVMAPLLLLEPFPLPSGQIDWWAMIGKYPNHVTSVMWGPHHAIVAWLGAALMMDMIRRRSSRWVGVPVSLAVLNSPFVAIGLLPLVAFVIFGTSGNRLRRLRQSASVPFVLSVTAVIPALAYLQVAMVDLPATLQATIETGFALTNPIVPDLGLVRATTAYLLLIGLEVVVFIIPLRAIPAFRSSPTVRRLVITLGLTLVLFPLYRYGRWSDLAMRAVVPSMFVLAILVVRALIRMPPRSWQHLMLKGVLVIGLMGAVSEFTRVALNINSGKEVIAANLTRNDIDASSGVTDLAVSVYPDSPRFLAQYVGSTDSFFYEHFAAGEQSE